MTKALERERKKIAQDVAAQNGIKIPMSQMRNITANEDHVTFLFGDSICLAYMNGDFRTQILNDPEPVETPDPEPFIFEGKQGTGKTISIETEGETHSKFEIVSKEEIKPAVNSNLTPEESITRVTNNILFELHYIANSFCKIGHLLYQTRNHKWYLALGFKSIYEYGEEMLGFKRSSMSSYISVCERFSVRDEGGEPTGELCNDYKSYSYSQLIEMLNIPIEGLAVMNPQMTVREIKQLKKDIAGSSGQDDDPASVEIQVAENEADEPHHEIVMYNGDLTSDFIESGFSDICIQLIQFISERRRLRISIY